MKIYIRCSSHRARRKAADTLGRELNSFYSWETDAHFHPVTAEELAQVVTIKGVTQAKRLPQIHPCW